ncbi:MAG: T9SS type A sorting domain-containing protein [Bacteroidales bacterium]
MIRLVFTSVIVSAAIILIAQPIGSTWHFSYQSSNATGYVKLNYVKDTTLGFGNFQVLEKIRVEYAWPGIYDTTYLDKEYMLWKNDSVFRLIDNQSVLLFNFNATVGDTVVFKKKNPISQSCDSTGMAVVDSIGLQLIQGSYRKWISVTPVFGSTVGLHGKIIEGIGPIEDYFFPEYINCISDANEGGIFRCISEGGLVLYSTSVVEYCDYVNYVIDENTRKFGIYPNPFKDAIFINNDNISNSCKISMYTVNGQEIPINIVLIDDNNIKIESNCFSSGMYLLKINSAGKELNFEIINFKN